MGTIRVMSINLLVGRADHRALERVIEDVDPDVLACQELVPEHATIITRLLPYGHLDPTRNYHGLGIATRFPSQVERFPLAHRDGWRATLSADRWPSLDRDLEVINVHIQSPVDSHPVRARRNRKSQTTAIIDHVRENRRPRVLVGDMNATPAWRTYRRIAATMQDGPVATGTAARTWGPWWWAPRLLRIDHAFVDGALPLRSWIERIRGTDHAALVIEIDV